MRVCLVSKEISPWWGAGIGTYASNMARAWASCGHEVHVVTHAHRGIREEAARLLRGVMIHTIETLPSREPAFVAESRAVRRVLEDLHRAQPFDVIEFPDYWAEGFEAIRTRHEHGSLDGAVLLMRLHTPTRTCRLLNGEPVDRGDEADLLDRREYAAIAGADVLVSPSRSLLDIVTARLESLGLGVEARPTAVVAYPFDVARCAEELGGGGGERDACEVLYLGRLEHRKGVDLLVQAAVGVMSRGVACRVRMVGGDTMTGPGLTSMRRHLEHLIRRSGFDDNFTIEASRPRRELGALLHRTAIVCVPSRWDNFPNVCLEAMSLGCCVVGTDSGGIGEIIEGGISGMLSRPRDADDLSRVLEHALRDEEVRSRVRDAAPRRIAALCDPSRIVGEMVRVIEDVRSGRWPGMWREPDPPRCGMVRRLVRSLRAR